MTNLTFGEKLELAFEASVKKAKTIGESPVLFCDVCVEGVEMEITKSVSHPWSWKVVNKATSAVKLTEDKWGLCYVDKV